MKAFVLFFFLQGPIISGNKKLIAEKLAEAEAERKVKGEAKDKQLVIHTFYSLLMITYKCVHCHVFKV